MFNVSLYQWVIKIFYPLLLKEEVSQTGLWLEPVANEERTQADFGRNHIFVFLLMLFKKIK